MDMTAQRELARLLASLRREQRSQSGLAPHLVPPDKATAYRIAGMVAEELLFRRILFAALRARKGFWASALISGLAFALFHGKTALLVFPVGVYLCWVYERERRLPVNILLHGLINLSVTAFKALA